jgi:hypothetical protein
MICKICGEWEKSLLGVCSDGIRRCCWCCQHEGHIYDKITGRCLEVMSRRSRTCYRCRTYTHKADHLKRRQKVAQTVQRGLQQADCSGRGGRLIWTL